MIQALAAGELDVAIAYSSPAIAIQNAGMQDI